MTDPEHIETELPELDRTDDPRGGAIVWALLAMGVAVIAGIVLALGRVAGAW